MSPMKKGGGWGSGTEQRLRSAWKQPRSGGDRGTFTEATEVRGKAVEGCMKGKEGFRDGSVCMSTGTHSRPMHLWAMAFTEVCHGWTSGSSGRQVHSQIHAPLDHDIHCSLSQVGIMDGACVALSSLKVEAKVRAREEGQRLQDSIQVTMLFKVLRGTTEECLGPSSACLVPCSCCPLVLKLSRANELRTCA